MTAAELLVRLWARGIELFADGEALRYRAPARVMTERMKAAITVAKAELLELVLAQTLAEYGLRQCSQCGHIQCGHHFETLGDICDVCRGVPEQAELFDAQEDS